MLLPSPLLEPFSSVKVKANLRHPRSLRSSPHGISGSRFFPTRHKKTTIRKGYADGALSHPYRSGRAHSSRVRQAGVLPPRICTPTTIPPSASSLVIASVINWGSVVVGASCTLASGFGHFCQGYSLLDASVEALPRRGCWRLGSYRAQLAFEPLPLFGDLRKQPLAQPPPARVFITEYGCVPFAADTVPSVRGGAHPV